MNHDLDPMRSESADPEGLLAAAAKRRKKPDSEPEMADTLGIEPPRAGKKMAAKAAPAESAKKAERVVAAHLKLKGKRAQRAVLTDDAVPGAPERPVGPGLITRGVHAGLGAVDSSVHLGRRLGAWGLSACAAAIAVVSLAGFAARQAPEPAPVRGMRIFYLDGPQLADRDLFGLIRQYPDLNALRGGNGDTLADFSSWLAAQPAVLAVHKVRYLHVPSGERRVVEVTLGLRTPELPVVLATGGRAWLAADGVLLPGIMPAPDARPRPVVRGLEGADSERVSEALWLWSELSRRLEPGLISDIHLNADLELRGQQGIVLGTIGGSRLIWGLPTDARYGIDRQRKVDDLLHTIRCQGDLARIATINVRYQKAFFTLR